MSLEHVMATKLGVPGLPAELVRRRRLESALDEASVPPLILVSAPPGFGKSTLLVQWLHGWPGAVGWLSLDAGDNDPALFLRGLWMAARSIAGQSGGPDPGPVPPPDISVAGPARVVAEVVDLLIATPRPSVIVLDDYQFITNRVVHEALALLVSRLPAGAHLAIATRADPPLPLARLRARKELLEIRADALRFSSDEAALLLRARFDVVLDGADVDWLVEQTEGWVSAIQLAGLSLRDKTNASETVRGFGAGHRFILDFVAEEVLAGLPPATFDFLIRTSVLERLCGSLCDAVAIPGGSEAAAVAPVEAGSGGQAMLEDLERANLFVVPLDDERRWYRYHHLFADILRARLALLHPDWLPTLHARAATWLEAHGLIDDAVRHALASRDGQAARRLIRRHWLATIHAGEIDTVGGWLAALPETIVRPDPQLNAIRAWLPVLRGNGDGVDEHIRAAESALATGHADVDPEDMQVVPVQLACIRSHLARLAGDAAAAESFAVTAHGLVPDSLPPAPRAILLGDATILIAYARILGGDLAGAVVALREARPLLVEGGNLMTASRATARLARLELQQGDSAAAIGLCAAAITEAEASGQAGRPGLAILHVALAEALRARGDIEGSRAAATRGLALARAGGDVVALVEGRDILERIEGTTAVESASSRGERAPDSLSGRELEVLRLVALGYSNRQIAAALFLALGTVKSHVHSICGKLGAQSRVEAIARARATGLL